MDLIEYRLEEHVAVLTMNSGENRFNPSFLHTFHAVLDEIETRTAAKVLVVTSAHQKIWSNGIDLEWLAPLAAADPNMMRSFPVDLTGLYEHLLTFPMITIAAINGHAFAGGAIMAACFDFRFMRSDRGYLCLPEVDLGIPLLPSMVAVMLKAVPWAKFMEMQLTGARVTAAEAQAHGMIMKACPEAELMPEVMRFAQAQQKARSIVGEMKKITYNHIVRIRAEDDQAWLARGRTGLG